MVGTTRGHAFVKDIPAHRQAFIRQNSLINGPTSRPSLRACIVFWAIPIFNRKPLIHVNGVGEGGGGGIGNMSRGTVI